MGHKATVYLPQLLPWQREVIEHPARYKVVACGRQTGKTLAGEYWIAEGALPVHEQPDGSRVGYPCAYMVPVNKMATQTWRELKEMLGPIIEEKNEQERYMRLSGGGSVEIWSLDNPEGPRGRRYKRVVIDEAAFIRDGAIWDATVQPTTIALRGSVLFLSTPRGYNWFWKLFQVGQDEREPEWASFQFPTSANPIIRPEEITHAQRRLPVRIFDQEYLAKFVSEGGQIFRNVQACATAERQERPIDGHQYVIGADFAKSEDFSVFTVWDVTTQSMARLERTNTLDWNLQINHLRGLCALFRPAVVVAEKNAMGDVIIDLLRQDNIPVHAFFTSGVTKAALVQDMAFAFDSMSVRILDDPVLIAELNAYEGFQGESGAVRYSAPRGAHDDTVMSLMLAYHGANTHTTVQAHYWRIPA